MSCALRVMSLNNPDTVVNLPLAFHPHIIKLLIQRSSQVAVTTRVNFGELLDVGSNHSVSRARVRSQDHLLLLVDSCGVLRGVLVEVDEADWSLGNAILLHFHSLYFISQ